MAAKPKTNAQHTHEARALARGAVEVLSGVWRDVLGRVHVQCRCTQCGRVFWAMKDNLRRTYSCGCRRRSPMDSRPDRNEDALHDRAAKLGRTLSSFWALTPDDFETAISAARAIYHELHNPKEN